jgi:hypothetical protein
MHIAECPKPVAKELALEVVPSLLLSGDAEAVHDSK